MITVKLTDEEGTIDIGYADQYNTEDATWDVLCNCNSAVEYDVEANEYTATLEEAEWWQEYFVADEKCQSALDDANLTEDEMIYYNSELNCDTGDQPIRGLAAIELLLSQR